MDRLKNEPVLIVSAIVAALMLAGVNLTDAQVDAVKQIVFVVVLAAGAAKARSKVTPTRKP